MALRPTTRGSYPGLPDELRKQQLWRGNTAMHTPFGSTLQAYCRNRDRQRVISNWGHEKFVALPFDDGGVIGSKIALFAGPATEALRNPWRNRSGGRFAASDVGRHVGEDGAGGDRVVSHRGFWREHD